MSGPGVGFARHCLLGTRTTPERINERVHILCNDKGEDLCKLDIRKLRIGIGGVPTARGTRPGSTNINSVSQHSYAHDGQPGPGRAEVDILSNSALVHLAR